MESIKSLGGITVILIRHADYAEDGDKLTSGHGGLKSGHLTPLGFVQSLLAAKFLSRLADRGNIPPVGTIWTSDAVRGIETGKVIREALLYFNNYDALVKSSPVFFRDGKAGLLAMNGQKDSLEKGLEELHGMLGKSSHEEIVRRREENLSGAEEAPETPGAERTVVAVVHEPFFDSLGLARPEKTGGYIISSRFSEPIRFGTDAMFDAEAIDRHFHSVILGYKVLGDGLDFDEAVHNFFTSPDTRKLREGYRDVHRIIGSPGKGWENDAASRITRSYELIVNESSLSDMRKATVGSQFFKMFMEGKLAE